MRGLRQFDIYRSRSARRGGMSDPRSSIRVVTKKMILHRTGAFMDWQAADDWQGGEPGRDGVPAQGGGPGQPLDLPALLAAFGHGGAWETAAPSAALAVALETAAGPGLSSA